MAGKIYVPDGTRFVIAILESLMGASYPEVKRDFLITHYNYYGVKPESEKAAIIADGTLREQLKFVFGKDPAKADLAKEAYSYLQKTGLSAAEITKLKNCLAKYRNTMKVTKSVKTVKKKTRKGTYKIKVRVTAEGNGMYQKMNKELTVAVKVSK